MSHNWPRQRPAVASLLKPRSQPVPPDPLGGWLASGIHALTPKKASGSSSSSLFALEAESPEGCETGVIADLVVDLKRVANALWAAAQWWMEADFRRIQVPVLVVALLVWAVSARWAWVNQNSATPLLVETISSIRQEQAGAITVGPITRPQVVSGPAATPNNLPSTVVRHTPRPSHGLAHWVATTFGSLLLPQPAPPEVVEGNPKRRVWVDMKTGLYYCPGADYYGYGGDSRGKVMSQKEAQYDYFQPATGAPCE